MTAKGIYDLYFSKKARSRIPFAVVKKETFDEVEKEMKKYVLQHSLKKKISAEREAQKILGNIVVDSVSDEDNLETPSEINLGLRSIFEDARKDTFKYMEESILPFFLTSVQYGELLQVKQQEILSVYDRSDESISFRSRHKSRRFSTDAVETLHEENDLGKSFANRRRRSVHPEGSGRERKRSSLLMPTAIVKSPIENSRRSLTNSRRASVTKSIDTPDNNNRSLQEAGRTSSNHGRKRRPSEFIANMFQPTLLKRMRSEMLQEYINEDVVENKIKNSMSRTKISPLGEDFIDEVVDLEEEKLELEAKEFNLSSPDRRRRKSARVNSNSISLANTPKVLSTSFKVSKLKAGIEEDDDEDGDEKDLGFDMHKTL